jgi:hypothetical protein
MHSGFFWQVLYWFSTPLLAALATVLIWRRLYREFPFFFSYVSIALVDDVARLIAYRQSFKVYATTFWISQLINSVVAILPIYELFIKRIFPQFQKIGFYRVLFSLAALVIIVLAVLTGIHSIRVVVLFNILHGLDFFGVATLIFFVALMLFMGRRWGTYELGIAFGFGLDAAGFLIAWAIWTKPGYLRNLAALVPVIAYDLACLIWLIYFLQVEKPRQAAMTVASPELVQQARQWEEGLRDSLTRNKPRT